MTRFGNGMVFSIPKPDLIEPLGELRMTEWGMPFQVHREVNFHCPVSVA
jgi:hypothetical protein